MEWKIGNSPTDLLLDEDIQLDDQLQMGGFWNSLVPSHNTIKAEKPPTSAIPVDSSGKNKKRRRKPGRVDAVKRLQLEHLKAHFHKPINEAAEQLGVGVSYFKKHVRALGIGRWPSRKLCSLRDLVVRLRSEPDCPPEEVAHLENEYRRILDHSPDLGLSGRAKKHRQRVFKEKSIAKKLDNVTTLVRA